MRHDYLGKNGSDTDTHKTVNSLIGSSNYHYKKGIIASLSWSTFWGEENGRKVKP